MSKPILCIYHGYCADGFAAAWAVREALGEEQVEFYPGRHGEHPPNAVDQRVVLVDFAYKREGMQQLFEEAESVLVLDHHRSALSELGDMAIPPQEMIGTVPSTGAYAFFDMNRSGAMIAWDWFHPGDPAPQLLHHIQDRDLWRFDLEGTREIQSALFSYPYDFEVWGGLMRSSVDELWRDDEAIHRKLMKDAQELIDTKSHRLFVGDHEVPALNAPYFFASEAGHIMAQDDDFAVVYWYNGDGTYEFSLRSRENGKDVSEIAQSYGGGGHKHAAGFRVDRQTYNAMLKV